jgi:hypothetical protein
VSLPAPATALPDPIMNALLPPLSLPFLLLAAVALWAPVMLTALQRRRLLQWWTDLPVAALAGALAALAAVLLLPPGPAVAVFGLAAAAWAWPLLVLRRARRGG